MHDRTAAKRYAKSIFDLSLEMGQLDAVYKDMVLINEVMLENRQLRLILQNPLVKHTHKLSIIRQIFLSRMNDITIRFFDIITKKSRELLIHEMAQEFMAIYKKYHKILEAKVIVASPLDEDTLGKMKQIVQQETKSNDVELTTEVDENILGGFMLLFGDKMIDETIKGRLVQLKKDIKSNITVN